MRPVVVGGEAADVDTWGRGDDPVLLVSDAGRGGVGDGGGGGGLVLWRGGRCVGVGGGGGFLCWRRGGRQLRHAKEVLEAGDGDPELVQVLHAPPANVHDVPLQDPEECQRGEHATGAEVAPRGPVGEEGRGADEDGGQEVDAVV